MSFIELDPEVIWKAIEGYQNELEPENRKLEALYRQMKCPRCGGSCQKEFSPIHAFSDPSTPVARALLRCTSCLCLFDPHVLTANGQPLILELGNPARETP